jgi:hypothetical protein
MLASKQPPLPAPTSLTSISSSCSSRDTTISTRSTIPLWPIGCYLPLPPVLIYAPTDTNRPLSANEIVLFQSLIPPLKIIVYNYAIPYVPPDVPIPSQWRFPIITRPPLPTATRRIAWVSLPPFLRSFPSAFPFFLPSFLPWTCRSLCWPQSHVYYVRS